MVVRLTPTSRGDVTLRSSNPFDAPIVNPKYLGSAYDRFEMRESARKAIQFVGSTAFEDYVLDPVDPKIGPNISDDDLDTYIADNARAGVHGVGTAAMSPEGATYGVVDPDLRVKGTIGLRVVDASVLPIVPAAHTQGPVYIMAERAADLIKESWGAPASEADFQSESVLEAPDQQILLSL
ncbi:hypothetical protein H0H93_016037 [Arthromyces matolae]|nr:hypothetical protein H0H93_016037 [Arthromyces matolae]